MRKLFCLGATGLALAAFGYRALEHSHTPDVAASARVAEHCVHCNHATDEECGSTAGDGKSESHPACGEVAGSPRCMSRTEAIQISENHETTSTIDLTRACSDVQPSIYIPDGDEPLAKLPDGDPNPGEESESAHTPRVMPVCDDDAVAPRVMPLAEDDPWPVKTAAPVKSVGWFEDAAPAGSDMEPACREDENLSRQYPGCPATGETVPASKGVPQKSAPWRHEKDPILPVPPEFGSQSEPPAWFDDVAPIDSARRTDDERGSQFWSIMNGVLRHVTLKPKANCDADVPARQHVDTLELRPSDLRRDANGAEHLP